MTVRRRSRASSCRCGDHRSQYECDVATKLLEAGAVFEYEAERIEYYIPKIYVPDYTLASGRVIEAKGWFPQSDRQKMQAVLRDNPDLELLMLFQRPTDKIRRGSKTTIAQWCEARNIPWAKGPEVPKEWQR